MSNDYEKQLTQESGETFTIAEVEQCMREALRQDIIDLTKCYFENAAGRQQGEVEVSAENLVRGIRHSYRNLKIAIIKLRESAEK